MQSNNGYLENLSEFIGQSIDTPEARNMVAFFGMTITAIPVEGGASSRFLSSKDRGIQIRFDENGIIRTIFIYSVKREGFSPYREDILPGVPAAAERKAVLDALGAPVESGLDSHSFFSQDPSWWDRYDRAKASYHIQYSGEAGAVEFITIREPPKTEA